MEHARLHPRMTLGVAAFSVSQMNEILDQLEHLRRQNPGYESFFSNHQDEPFFVKNLENVQGDERDVIFISVGYGRSADRVVNILLWRAQEPWERAAPQRSYHTSALSV